ncbi:hypothetical protein N7530_010760 [Penicillium desertorum]|uniref:Uncharacterized protein n=1 Tax=Penicillium desertorum TaxID=1303715 RepID=A0A9W9WFY7_9EURO|nr:hypothetical protein N7530_010760 [Penicillium desertorum]
MCAEAAISGVKGGRKWPPGHGFSAHTFGPRATRSSPAPGNAHRHVLVRSCRCLGAWLSFPCPRAPLVLSIDFYLPLGLLLER